MSEQAKQTININAPRPRIRPRVETAPQGGRPKGAIDVTDGVFWKQFSKTRVLGCLVWAKNGVLAYAKKDAIYQPLGSFASADLAASAIRDANPLFDPHKVVVRDKPTTRKPRSRS